MTAAVLQLVPRAEPHAEVSVLEGLVARYLDAHEQAGTWPRDSWRRRRGTLLAFAEVYDGPLDEVGASAGRWLRGLDEHRSTRYNRTKHLTHFTGWLEQHGHVPRGGGLVLTDADDSRGRGQSPLAKLAERYVRQRVATGAWRTETVTNQRKVLRSFCKAYGHRPVAQLGRGAVLAWLESTSTLAPATRRTYFSAAKVFCGWLVAERHLTRDPFLEVPRPKVPRSLPRNLPGDDVGRLLAAAGDDTRARFVITVMVQQGLRVGEVARLELADIDRTTGTLRVAEGKGGHQRLLPLVGATLAALDAYLDAEPMRGTGPIVRTRGHGWNRAGRGSGGMNPGSIRTHIVTPLMTAAGVKSRAWDRVGSHSLRHTCAADLLMRGAHIRDVQAVLGHADLSSTQVYLPLVTRDLREVMEGRTYGGG